MYTAFIHENLKLCALYMFQTTTKKEKHIFYFLVSIKNIFI